MARRARAVTARQAARKYRSNQDEGSFEVRYAAAAGDNVCRTSFDAVGDPAVALAFRRPLVALGIFLRSAYGTCPQRVAAADHTNRLRRGHPPTRHRGCTSTQEKRLTPPHPPRTGVRSGQMKGTLSACQSSREDRE
jgi:hypothetical protein